MAEKPRADVGLIGLAVMGQNLALNMADHGFKVAVFNRTVRVTKDFIDAHPDTPGGLVGCENLADFLGAVKAPRKIVILVKAGPAVDIVAKQLIEAGLDKEDLLVDCGNSQWTDTIRRGKEYSDRCRFFGSGVSGGEIGARFGPSLMPGGDAEAWKLLEPIWTAIAAKVDAETGKPIETAKPGHPVTVSLISTFRELPKRGSFPVLISLNFCPLDIFGAGLPFNQRQNAHGTSLQNEHEHESRSRTRHFPRRRSRHFLPQT